MGFQKLKSGDLNTASVILIEKITFCIYASEHAISIDHSRKPTANDKIERQKTKELTVSILTFESHSPPSL